MNRPTALLAVTCLLAVSCGSAPAEETSTSAPPQSAPSTTSTTSQPAAENTAPVTVTLISDGGCAMIGPNCPTYVLGIDGSFTLHRTGNDEVEAEGSIDQDLTRRLFDEIAVTDLDHLMSTLGPGECRACVDGIDTRVEIDFGDRATVLDSTVHRFDQGIELFRLVSSVAVELTLAAELTPEAR